MTPIESSVDVEEFDVPAAAVTGDRASVEYATIRYRTHFAPGTWTEDVVGGVTMCHYELEHVDGEWRVTDEACNVSGG